VVTWWRMCLVSIVIGGAVLGCVDAGQLPVSEIVARMEDAEAQVEDFHGLVESTLIPSDSGVTTLVQEIWRKDPDLLRIEVREGPAEMVGRITVYNGSHVWSYDPHMKSIQEFELEAPLELAPQELDAAMHATAEQLVQEGTAKHLGEETVAGRTTYRIQFVPRSGTDLDAAAGGRPIEVWLDKEHSRRVRMEIPLATGERYVMQYRTMEYNLDLPDGLFELTHPGAKAAGRGALATPPAIRQVHLADAQEAARFPLLLPAYLPPGMILVGVAMFGGGDSFTLSYRGHEEVLTISEAVASRGVEFPRFGDQIHLRGTTGRLQQQNERGVSLRWQEGDLVIFISGTTSVEEALKIAQSMH
jgi:outer membrane lipoprotein-sorting protein